MSGCRRLRVSRGNDGVAQLDEAGPAAHVGSVSLAALVLEHANQRIQLGHAAAVARVQRALGVAGAIDQDLEIVDTSK